MNNLIHEKYMRHISLIAMLLAVIFVVSALYIQPTKELVENNDTIIEEVLNKEKITEVNIEISETDWQWLLDNATKEEYRSGNITINGETFYNVGIRPKGNSSLSMVASDDTTDRFSLKIDFGEYVQGQTYHGIRKLALNNMMSDKTYMKEYISYDVLSYLDVPTPEYSYANISINGKEWGLYLAVEVIEERFVKKQFGSLEGNLYKPDSISKEDEGRNQGGMPQGRRPPMGENQQSKKNQSRGVEGGGNLKYIDDKVSSYSAIVDGTVFETTTDEDLQRVIDMIKNLNEGKDIEKYIDVDEVLAYFAVNTFLVNLDSYSGGMYHNYYLYEKNGIFQIIPWDYNMSFAGFKMNNSSEAINFPIDNPVTGNILEAPLIGKLLEVDEYKEIYHDYLRKLANEYFNSGKFESTINKLDNLIDGYVKKDDTAFYSYDEYKNSLAQLNIFGTDRTKSILAQLEGTQPSTNYGNITTTLKLTELGGTIQKNKGRDMKSENMLSKLKNIGPEMGKPPIRSVEVSKENHSTFFSFSMYNIVQLGLSTIALLIGMVFVKKFRRK